VSDGVGIELKVKGMDRLVDRMKRFVPAYRKAQEETMRRSGQLMLTRVVYYASGGGQGPQVRTGAYVRSINLEVSPSGWRVYTNAPQARRLEYGFVGTDSLGRHYSQAPLPHWRPAAAEMRKASVQELKSLPKSVWRSL